MFETRFTQVYFYIQLYTYLYTVYTYTYTVGRRSDYVFKVMVAKVKVTEMFAVEDHLVDD